MFCVLCRRLFWRNPKPVRAAGKPKQNARGPQGGGQDPKQCPVDAQRDRAGDQLVGILYNGAAGSSSGAFDCCPRWNNASQKVIIAIIFRPSLGLGVLGNEQRSPG